MQRTGAFGVDQLMGGSGLTGVVELYGPTLSGKTTLAYGALREARLAGEGCLLIHTVGLPDKEYLLRMCDPGLPVFVPAYGEDVFDAAYFAVERGARVVVIDSTAGINSVLDGGPLIYSPTRAARSRTIFNGLSHLRWVAEDRGALVLVLSEIRANIGHGGTRSAAGDALLGVIDARIELYRTVFATAYGAPTMTTHSATVTHLSGKPPSGAAEFRCFPDVGIDRNVELIQALLERGALENRGSYLRSVLGKSYGPGYANASAQIAEDYNEHMEILLCKE